MGCGFSPARARGVGRSVVVSLVVVACATDGGTAAAAAQRAAYAEWTLSGKSGSVVVPAVGHPPGTFTTDSTRTQVPSGNSTFLNAATPFGAQFGSSRGREYLSFGTASGGRPSSTTITFRSPAQPGNWGFALGDIDADTVRISAMGPDGAPLTAAQLGWRGAFNYCAPSPRPSACRRGSYTDMPSWNAATSTLAGNVADTDGAAGWFRPTAAVKSLTLTFSVQSGIPVGQLWIAAKWAAGKPDIAIAKRAEPRRVTPGGTVTYTVSVTNKGTVAEPDAEFIDDLSDVIDDARYNNDARANAGTIAYSKPRLRWHGPVNPGQTRTVTYSVRVHRFPKGNRKIRNAIIGDGPRMTCQDARARGCKVTVKIRRQPACRYATAPAPEARHRQVHSNGACRPGQGDR